MKFAIKFATFVAVLTCVTPLFAVEPSPQSLEQIFRQTLLERERKAEPDPDAFLAFVKTFFNSDGTPVTEQQILEQSGATKTDVVTPEMHNIFSEQFTKMLRRIDFIDHNKGNAVALSEEEFKEHNYPAVVIRYIRRIFEEAEVFTARKRFSVRVQIGSRQDKAVLRELVRALLVACRENLNDCVGQLVMALGQNLEWINVFNYESAVDLFSLLDSFSEGNEIDARTKRKIKNILFKRFLRSGPRTCAKMLVEPPPKRR